MRSRRPWPRRWGSSPRPHRAADPGPGLRRRVGAHHRRVGRRLEHRGRDEGTRRRAQRAHRPHRRCRLRRARHLRWRHPHPQPHPRAAAGHHVQPVPRHRRLLPDPRGPADRPQPPPGRHGRHRGVPGAVPRLHRGPPPGVHALPRILRENGYVTAGFGKWHITPGREMGAAGSFDHWPTGWGFDHWWGFLTGAAGQYDPIITQDNSTARRARGRGRQALLLPRRHHRQDRRVAARRPGAGRRQAVVRLLLHRRHARPAPRGQGVGRQVQGPVRRRLGRLPRADPRAPEAAGRRPARHRADAAGRTPTPPGTASRTPSAGCTPARWRCSPGSPRTPTGTSAACSTPSRRWASSTTPSSSTSGATTAPRWRARSPARSTRRRSSTASSSTPRSSWP